MFRDEKHSISHSFLTRHADRYVDLALKLTCLQALIERESFMNNLGMHILEGPFSRSTLEEPRRDQ